MRWSPRDFLDPIAARTERHPTRTGAIVLVLGVLLIVGTVLHEIPILDSQSGYTIRADFAKVNNVNNRTPVRVDGVHVGMVTGIGPGPDPRRSSQLQMLITHSGLVIHDDASAAIRWRTVLGGPMYIDLNPGSPDAPRLRGPIPVSRTSYQTELDDVLRIYNGSTDQAQREMLKGLSQGLAAPAAIRGSIGALPDLTTVGAGLRPLQGSDPGDLSGLVRTTARTAQELGANVVQLQSLVSGAAQTFGALDAQSASLGRMLSLSPGTLDSTSVTMRRIQTTLDRLDPLVTRLQPGAQLVASMSSALRPALSQARGVLDQAQPLLHTARPTFADLRAASRTGVPLLTGLMAPINRLNGNILPWLGRRDSDTRLLNYEAIGPFFSVLDKAAAEYDSSGYRLHLSTLLGSASVIDQSTLAGARSSMMSECLAAARPAQRRNCRTITALLVGALFGGAK